MQFTLYNCYCKFITERLQQHNTIPITVTDYSSLKSLIACETNNSYYYGRHSTQGRPGGAHVYCWGIAACRNNNELNNGPIIA